MMAKHTLAWSILPVHDQARNLLISFPFIRYEDEDEEDWPGAGGRLQRYSSGFFRPLVLMRPNNGTDAKE